MATTTEATLDLFAFISEYVVDETIRARLGASLLQVLKEEEVADPELRTVPHDQKLLSRAYVNVLLDTLDTSDLDTFAWLVPGYEALVGIPTGDIAYSYFVTLFADPGRRSQYFRRKEVFAVAFLEQKDVDEESNKGALAQAVLQAGAALFPRLNLMISPANTDGTQEVVEQTAPVVAEALHAQYGYGAWDVLEHFLTCNCEPEFDESAEDAFPVGYAALVLNRSYVQGVPAELDAAVSALSRLASQSPSPTPPVIDVDWTPEAAALTRVALANAFLIRVQDFPDGLDASAQLWLAAGQVLPQDSAAASRLVRNFTLFAQSPAVFTGIPRLNALARQFERVCHLPTDCIATVDDKLPVAAAYVDEQLAVLFQQMRASKTFRALCPGEEGPTAATATDVSALRSWLGNGPLFSVLKEELVAVEPSVGRVQWRRFTDAVVDFLHAQCRDGSWIYLYGKLVQTQKSYPAAVSLAVLAARSTGLSNLLQAVVEDPLWLRVPYYNQRVLPREIVDVASVCEVMLGSAQPWTRELVLRVAHIVAATRAFVPPSPSGDRMTPNWRVFAAVIEQEHDRVEIQQAVQEKIQPLVHLLRELATSKKSIVTTFGPQADKLASFLGMEFR